MPADSLYSAVPISPPKAMGTLIYYRCLPLLFGISIITNLFRYILHGARQSLVARRAYMLKLSMIEEKIQQVSQECGETATETPRRA